MVYIVGLERIAEELMGRRKWKLYQQQDSMQRNNYLVDVQQLVDHQQQDHQSAPAPPIIMMKPPLSTSPIVVANNKINTITGEVVKVEQEQPVNDRVEEQPPPVHHQEEAAVSSGEDIIIGEGGDPKADEELMGRLTPEPQDWSPPTKCHFCVDGKLQDDNCSLGQDHQHHLLTSHGALSPRGGPPSDSDSTADSLSDSECSPPSLLSTASTTTIATTPINSSSSRLHRHRHHHQAQHRRPRSNSDASANSTNHHHHHHAASKLLQFLPPPLNMATLDSMTLAAMAAISGGGGNGAVGTDNGNNQAAVSAATAAAAAAAAAAGYPYYPGAPSLPAGATLQQQHNLFQIANAMRSAAAASAAVAAAAAGAESDKDSGSGGGRGGEQPLDLSAKPTGNNSTDKLANNIRLAAALDTKHIFKAKPRMPTVAGRRTYTEEELQAALRDIQSGKLGTRRAAVIYGIPRSTLRNKVYKLALERERETHLNSSSSSSTPTAVVLKLEDEDAIMDDDKELSGAEEEKEVEKALQAPLLTLADFAPDALKSLLIGRSKEEPPINPYLHSFLLGSQGGPKFVGDAGVLPELIKRMFEDQMAKAHQLQQQHNNGDSSSPLVIRPSPSNSVIVRTATRSESDMETEESASNVILKIPSYKPTGSSSSNKNGDMSLYHHRSSLDSSGSMVSPPVTSDSGSPPISNLHHPLKDVKDVIAASISKKFQQSEQPEQLSRPLLRHSISHPESHMLDFKRTGGFTPPLGGISVIKTQDLTRQSSYPAPSNKPTSHHHQQQQQQQHSSSNSSNSSSSGNANAAGGKGTRPKRGKYRNYDRDSLVEAVRAVQRGEMSVHRAGSYYGVPHSTLEYKVKERHLMRPRKRDPKPNPVDEKIASLKQNDQALRLAQDAAAKLPISGVAKIPTPGGLKQSPQQGKFPPNSPNGIKLPLFDPMAAAGAPIGFNPAPFPFWTPTFHSHIPTLDFNPSQSFANNSAEHHQQQLLASQVMAKLHDDATRRSLGHPPNNSSLPKSHRHIAESLLDGCTSNGSFLDGIIRSSLESGLPQNDKILTPENLSNKALLEQLMCRNTRLKSSMSETSSGDELDAGTTYRKEAPSPNDNSMEHDPETIELSNDSQPQRTRDEDEEEAAAYIDQREEMMVKQQPPVQGRIYVKHDLMDQRGPSEGLLRFRDFDGAPVGVLDRNGSVGAEECPAEDNASAID